MQRRSRSILEELNKISAHRDRNHVVENRGAHIIDSAIHLIEEIEKHYEPEVAKDLTNRLVNSIRGRDGKKFTRGMKRVQKDKK